MLIIYHAGSWVWALRWRRRLRPCVMMDLWHCCLSAYMPMNIAKPRVNCSLQTSGGMPWSINRLWNGRELLVPCDCSSTSSLSLVKETVAWRRSHRNSRIRGRLYWLWADLQLLVRLGEGLQLLFHNEFVCVCFLTFCHAEDSQKGQELSWYRGLVTVQSKDTGAVNKTTSGEWINRALEEKKNHFASLIKRLCLILSLDHPLTDSSRG